MPRRLGIEFDNAIYHVMSRGNMGQDIVQRGVGSKEGLGSD